MKKILLSASAIMAVFCFFCASFLAAYVYDLDFIGAYERYELDPRHDDLTFEEWKQADEQKMENFKNYLLDECADALVFPPWKVDTPDMQENPSAGNHNNERGDN